MEVQIPKESYVFRRESDSASIEIRTSTDSLPRFIQITFKLKEGHYYGSIHCLNDIVEFLSMVTKTDLSLSLGQIYTERLLIPQEVSEWAEAVIGINTIEVSDDESFVFYCGAKVLASAIEVANFDNTMGMLNRSMMNATSEEMKTIISRMKMRMRMRMRMTRINKTGR